jgi:hypothetical protein
MEAAGSQRVQGAKGSTANAKELQRVESLAKIIRLFRDIQNNSRIPTGRNIGSNLAN